MKQMLGGVEQLLFVLFQHWRPFYYLKDGGITFGWQEELGGGACFVLLFARLCGR